MSGDLIRIPVGLSGHVVSTVLDSGAAINVINKDLVDLLTLSFDQKETGVRIRTLAHAINPLGVANFKVTLFGQQYPITAQVVNTRIFGGLLVGNVFMKTAGIDILNSSGHIRFTGADGMIIPIRRLWDSPNVIRVSGIRNRKLCRKCCTDDSKDLSDYLCLCDQRSSGSNSPVKKQTETTDSSETESTQVENKDKQKRTHSEKSETRTRRSRTGTRETTTVTTVSVTTRWLPNEYGCNDSDLHSSDGNQNKVRGKDQTRSREPVRSRTTNKFRSSDGYRNKLRKKRKQHIHRRKSVSSSETETEKTSNEDGLSQSPDMDSDVCPFQVTSSETECSADDSGSETANVLFMPDEWEALGQEVKPDPLSEPVINQELTEEKIREICILVEEYNHIFSRGEYDVGAAKTTPAVLDTGDHPPINSPNWRMKPAMNIELDRQIKALLKAGIIEPSTSPWNFPPVLVEKKSTKKFRLTINYQKLNSVLKKNAMIPPDIESIFDRLGGMNYKSLVDARSGYFQLLLDPDSREKTAFRGPYGLYQFTRLPQGLATAPAIFQTAMNEMLADLKNTCALAYMDDVLVFSRTLEEHIIHLRQVFERISAFGLKMSLDKSVFAMTEIEFLGRIITRDGIKPDPKKIQKITEYGRPVNQKDVMRFKGLCSFHRRLVKDFTLIFEPLQRMINDKTVKWGLEQESAFTLIKEKLTNAPILRFPDFTKQFYVVCDASNYHLGALLKQKDQNKHLCLIACESRKLSDVERRYATTYREFLGVIFGVAKFDRYITGRKFVIVTDHHALCFMLKSLKPGNSAITRWTMNMLEYDFDIEWTSGKSHKDADALSRPPGCEENADPDESVTDDRFHCILTDKFPLTSLQKIQQAADTGWKELAVISLQSEQQQSAAVLMGQEQHQQETPVLVLSEPEDRVIVQIEGLKEKQAADQTIQEKMQYLLTENIPVRYKNRQRFIKKMAHFVMKDGILCRKVLSAIGQIRLCPVVPESLQLKVLQGFHDSVTAGHQGTRNTVAKLREWYYWEGMWKSVDKYVRSCLNCLKNNIVRTAPMGEMIPLPSTCLPGEILSIDTMTDLTRTAKGHTALFVCTDRATRCVWAMPAYNKEARHAVKLLKRVMYQLGIPREVLTDGGREYNNTLFNDVCLDMGIRHAQTSRYHPQSNGQTERMNASLMQALRKYVRRDKNWDEHVEAVVYALNTSPNSHTQICPYSLLYGMTPPSPVRHVMTLPRFASSSIPQIE